MTIDLTQIIVSLISLIISPAVLIGIKEGITYLKAKTRSTLLRTLLEQTGDAATTAVTEIEQTYVWQLKQSGTWDGNAQRQALDLATGRALEIIGDKGLQLAQDLMVDINALLTAKIEAAVHDMTDSDGSCTVYLPPRSEAES